MPLLTAHARCATPRRAQCRPRAALLLYRNKVVECGFIGAATSSLPSDFEHMTDEEFAQAIPSHYIVKEYAGFAFYILKGKKQKKKKKENNILKQRCSIGILNMRARPLLPPPQAKHS